MAFNSIMIVFSSSSTPLNGSSMIPSLLVHLFTTYIPCFSSFQHPFCSPPTRHHFATAAPPLQPGHNVRSKSRHTNQLCSISKCDSNSLLNELAELKEAEEQSLKESERLEKDFADVQELKILEISVSFRTILNTIIRKLRLPKAKYKKGKDQITHYHKFSVNIRSPIFGSMHFEDLHFEDSYKAQQKACARAIEYLRTIYMFEIEDVNYSTMLYYNDVLNRAHDRIDELSSHN